MAKYSPEDLKTLVADRSSDVHLKKIAQKIPLQPVNLGNHVKAVRETLDRRLCKYDASLNGLILGYQKLEILKDTAQLHFDSSELSVQVQAEFYVFQPKIGHTYTGVLHNIGVAHVGCLLYNHFNVSLPIPPGKEGLLKTLTPQTKVSFILEEQTLPGDLPYFRGQLVGLNSKSADKSTKKNKRKESRDESEISPSLVKSDADGSKKRKMDKESKLALKSQCAAGSLGKEKVDKHAKLSLKRGEVSDKKKPRLSLKKVESLKRVEKDSSSGDDSDHIITPYQRPTENRSSLSNVKDDSLILDTMKLVALRDSPLKNLKTSDEDSSDNSFDHKDSLYKNSKSTQNSQSAKSSHSKTKEKSQVLSELSSPKVDVQSKSAGGKSSRSQALKSILPSKDDTSSEDEKKSSSEESKDEGRKQSVLPQTPTKRMSPQKGKSTSTKSSSKAKTHKSSSALSLAKPDVQAKSPGNKSRETQSTLVKVRDSSSENTEDSGSEDTEEAPALPQIPTKQASLQKEKSTPTESSFKAKSRKSGKALSLAIPDVLAKSPVGKSSEPEALNLAKKLKADYTSSEDEKESISEDSKEEGRKQPALFQSPLKRTSPQKMKSWLAESLSKEKVKSPKLGSALTLAKPKSEVKSSGSKSDEFLKVGNTSSKDSNSGDSDGDGRKSAINLHTSLLKRKNSPLATSTQKSPQRKLSLNISLGAKHEVSSSDDESEKEVHQDSRLGGSFKVIDEPQKSRPPPVTKHESSISEDSDSDDEDERPKWNFSKLAASVTAPAEQSSSEDSDSRPGKQREKTSDSKDVPKTPAQTRFQRPTAPEEDSSSDESNAGKPRAASAAKTSHSPEGSSSDSESERHVAAPAPSHVRNHSPTKPLSIKNIFQQKKSLLSQTYLDGSVHGRSPLACSTPTVESAATSHKKLKMPFVADVRDVEKTDEPKKKKKKESKTDKVKDQLKLTDSGFEDVKVDTKKKIEGKEDICGKPVVSSKAETKKHKKSKRKLELEIVQKEATIIASPCGHTFKHGKDKKNFSKAKDEKHLVEKMKDDVLDLGRKQSKVEICKPADVMKSTEDVNGKKSKKRKLSERTDENLGREVLPNPDLQKNEDCTKSYKKRKLYSPKDDESVGVINESLLKSHSSKPKESRKKGTTERIGKPKECVPSGQTDSKERRTVTSEPLNSGANTHTGSKRKKSVVMDSLENEFVEDNSMNRPILDVINKLTSEVCDKEKKKKKKKAKKSDVETDKATHDVAPSVESIEEVKRKKKKEKATDVNKIEKSAQDSASAVKIELDIQTLDGNQLVSKSETDAKVNSEKKLKKKKKEKPTSVAPAHEIFTLSVDSAVSSKKLKTDKTKSTDEILKKKEKETPRNVALVTPRDPSPPLSEDSAVSSKKKKTNKTKSTDGKKKKKENRSNVLPLLTCDLVPSFMDSAVSLKKKRTAKTTDSDDSKVSVKKKKKKKKKKKREENLKTKTTTHPLSAEGKDDSRDLDDMVNSLLRNFS